MDTTLRVAAPPVPGHGPAASDDGLAPPAETVPRADARRNRDRVLRAAHKEFCLHGHAVPMATIALRAGVGPGTIYRQFPTKEALFEAVVFEDLQVLAYEARGLVDADAPAAALYGFLAHLVEQGTASAAMRDALAGAVELGPFALRALGGLEASIASLLARAQARGQIRSEVSAADVLALLAVVHRPVDPDATASAARLFAVVWDGLCCTAASG